MSGGHFDYIQFRLDDIVSELETIIELEESINTDKVKCKEEVNLYVLKTAKKDGRTYVVSDTNRFLSYDDAYTTIFNEGYHIEAKVGKIGQRKFTATKDNFEYHVEEVTERRYIKDGEEVYPYEYSNKTIEELKRGVDAINKASVYIQRIDYLLSGDDGEESFHKRLKEDLEKNH